jgi:protein-S-isoprenylcysteine O-methyltransferase Ste14
MIGLAIAPQPSSWPAVLTGAILLIYWLRVLQMVARTRRTVGRAANFIPPERLGRVLRIVWIPVVTLWIALPLLVPFVVDPPWVVRPFPAIYGNRPWAWGALAVGVAAFTGTWVCWQRMGKSWRMGIDPNERTELVFTGPFAYVRNPIYGLSSVLAIVAMVVICSPLMLVVGALHLLLLQWEVRREERALFALHGDAYANYMARVGRFFPKLWRSA